MTDIFKRNPIRIPVKLVDGQWEFFYGGKVPVADGTIGDLIIDKTSVEDKEFLKPLTHKSDHKILDVGTKLLVALTIKSHALPEKGYCEWLIYGNEPGFKVEFSAGYIILSMMRWVCSLSNPRVCKPKGSSGSRTGSLPPRVGACF